MSNIIIYDKQGKILRSVSAPPSMLEMQIQLEEYGVEGYADVFKDYVLDGVITNKPLQQTTLDKTTLIADGVDVITITNTPNGTFTAINTTTNETITGSINGSDTFSTTIAGTYKINIESFPYLPFETTITTV